jgi:hypothetical protein
MDLAFSTFSSVALVAAVLVDDDQKKKAKINNILSTMRKKGIIKNTLTRAIVHDGVFEM